MSHLFFCFIPWAFSHLSYSSRQLGVHCGRQVSLRGSTFLPSDSRSLHRVRRWSLSPLSLSPSSAQLTLWHRAPRVGGGENEALELKNLQLVAKLLQVFELLAPLSETLSSHFSPGSSGVQSQRTEAGEGFVREENTEGLNYGQAIRNKSMWCSYCKRGQRFKENNRIQHVAFFSTVRKQAATQSYVTFI